MCSLQPFSLDTEQEDEDLHVVVKKSGVTVTINKEIEEISREEIIDETDSYQSNQSKLNERMHSHCRWAKNQHLPGLRGGRVRSASYTILPHTEDQSKKQGPA